MLKFDICLNEGNGRGLALRFLMSMDKYEYKPSNQQTL